MFEPFLDQNPYFFGMISLSWFFIQDYWKQIGSVVLGPNHSRIFFGTKFGYFLEVIFFDPSKIGVLGLTLRRTLLSRCYLNTLWSTSTCFKICVHLLLKNVKLLDFFYLKKKSIWSFSFSICLRLTVPVCKKGKNISFSHTVTLSLQTIQKEKFSLIKST